MKRKKKIVAVTGARSEYDLLYSVYNKLNQSSEFQFSIIITGPHLSENFGYTAQYVIEDEFKVEEKIYNLIDSNDKIGRIISIGHQIPALAQTLNRIKPDIVLVAGDREEAITVSLTAAYLNIAVAHFFGGDIAKDGNIDNSVRYAASKFSHIHFPTLEAHRDTLLKLGEDDWRIFVVGNPAIDRLIETPHLTKQELASRLGVTALNEEFLVLIQHSIITEIDQQSEHINITLEAIKDSGKFCFINYPNSDPGNYAIIEAYQTYSNQFPEQFKLFNNLDRITYINLLRHASCLLGNSSSGLLEAPSLGLPAINIGSRQRGRLHGSNVIFVDNNKEQIALAIKKTLNDKDFLKIVSKKVNPYGDGHSADKIIDILSNIEIDNKLLFKNITY